ncbi:hypothetical protein OIDMADRAFT_20935 [Oidiodendron maius Zn]|uniref:F-box domain-containing protein n=1 Tax=Oidiodendron maius (strain Zn) TaxID=913774 RepID=A0A0C3H0K0_OIDMZ|nr:hypothetical protein OIDMADRAFT_20935 [Oidiodendron maius Zn]
MEKVKPYSDPQTASPLCQIPRELRDQILICLLTSTRISFGKRRTSRMKSKSIKPAPHALAILRTCRLIHEETKFLWLPHVLFHFERPEDLLDKLSPLHPTTLSQIRYLRTGGAPLVLQPIDDDDDVYYRLAYTLKLLPGLSLNTLTVLGPSDGPIAYDTLDGLIEYGNGWRELHFITPNSSMLSFKKIDLFMAPPYWRKPQPASWNEILARRDGEGSGSSVTIYRATQLRQGSVIDNRTRQIFDQKAVANFGVEDDKELSALDEAEKELLVVVKRGQTTNIAEPDGPPFLLENDIRHWSYPMTWTEIRRRCIDHIGEFDDFDDDDDLFSSSGDEIEIDYHDDFAGYKWPDRITI